MKKCCTCKVEKSLDDLQIISAGLNQHKNNTFKV